MKTSFTTFFTTFTLLFSMLGCQKKKEDKAFLVFNEGVSLSLDALRFYERGDYKNSEDANKKAILKFEQTLQIDSTHKGARSALGHSFYLIGEFRKAIIWFEKANQIDEQTAPNLRELGLSKINLGQVPEGRQDLEKAFKLDTSQEIRKITADDLYDIGKLAFEYGEDYIGQGESEKGKTYKLFSIDVLRLGFEIDNDRKDIARTIVVLANKIGDKTTAAKYNAY
ncbi:hypothetical protein JAO73_10845 [Hymenobacter sp. BT523]|uniref:tetratricopeptide repeat protein n=1 Tax=Hymenobacter sp. BT523 TaxID=2795725 RepID=UPI0018EDE540|nr:hypothetical protein [Hymenobacter sp. BT523]MBJ6109514.1 hypothetical protein [Hymenobacter sp. BT523]